MNLLPVTDWINGIAMLPREPPRTIELPNQKPGTRCYLIEAVGPKGFEAGYRPGDIVVGKSVFDLLFYGGTFHRVKFKVDEIMDLVPASLEEFTDLAKKPILPSLDPVLITARRGREEAMRQMIAERRSAGMLL